MIFLLYFEFPILGSFQYETSVNCSTAEAVNNDNEQSLHDEAPNPSPAPPVRRRGIPRAVAQRQVLEQPTEPVAPEIDPTVFTAGMAGINQGLVALNQAMLLVQ